MIQETDIYGESTLKSISGADKFNRWMYDQMKPFMQGKILEIGSGIGNISSFLIKDHENVVLSDIRKNYVKKLQQQYSGVEVIQIDLVDPQFDKKYKNLFETFDFIFALNVVEHIENDKIALVNIYKLLKKGGYVFILVPAYQSLFNNFDIALEHYRRYTKESLFKLFHHFEPVRSYYFNFIGIFGWFVVGKLFGKKIIPESNMKIYNLLIPIFKVIDKILLNQIGLSVIQVAKKPNKHD